MARTVNAEPRRVDLTTLSILALILGVVTGIGAVLLRYLIGFIHNFAFLGIFSGVHDANLPTPPSPWGAGIILVPVIGGLIVVFLVSRFAPEAKGHGVPEVIDSIFYRGGRIRPVVVVVKSLASAISIGTGASVGREGPIIQIGSAIGSTLGQIVRLPSWQTITLVAAGAGAGIAATFNTPLGAVMFAIELMLPELSPRTLLPVILATGTATYVGRVFFGIDPAFMVPLHSRPELLVDVSVDLLPLYIGLGVGCGLASVLFIRVLHWVEDLFDDMPLNIYLRNILGMLSLGVLMYVLMLTTGQYHTAGVGYATIQDILTGDINVAWFLLFLFVAKLFATTVSLGAGASGGIFSPSLFLGAALGGFFGTVADMLWPHLGISPISFAVVGMAAIVGGSTGAAITAILMIFEMTGDYSLTVPSIVAVATAVGIRRALSEENIYTAKLARRGHFIPKERHFHMFQIRRVEEVMAPVVAVIPPDQLACVPSAQPQPGAERAFALVADGRKIQGVVTVERDRPEVVVSALARDFAISYEGAFLQSVMRRMSRRNRSVSLVVKGPRGVARPENVVGVIGLQEIGGAIISDFRD